MLLHHPAQVLVVQAHLIVTVQQVRNAMKYQTAVVRLTEMRAFIAVPHTRKLRSAIPMASSALEEKTGNVHSVNSVMKLIYVT